MKLDHLNIQQRQAVKEIDGPMMILAGAGSGKTRTLVTKIAYLLEEKNISPFQLLALTFSNKAAKEMRDRVGRDVSCDVGALQVTTFHSFCARLLRAEANYLGLSRNFTIYDTAEQKSVVKAILNRRGISQKETSPFEVMYFIEDLKNHGHYPDRDISDKDYEVEDDDIFYDMYLDYEKELHKANATDFGGLIGGVIQLFEKFPEVLERYQDRFRYILVDEYQDTNRAQFDLVTKLAKKRRNICVVGDEDQSIYSWRGADIRNILDFEEVYSDAQILKLEQNYRSSKNIIEAAGAVISRNTQRKGKSMWTDNPEGDSIDIIECSSDREEADFVSKEIINLHNEHGASYDEMSVFYRTNSQSRQIEDALRKSNIPYRVVGGIKFYERKEIKDLIAYIRLLVNDKDSLALSRIINVPTRGIGATTLRKIEEEAIKTDSSLWEVVNRIVDNPEDFKHIRLSSRVKSSMSQFVHLITEAKIAHDQGEPLETVYEKLLYESGYWEMLRASKDYESQARMENLEELGSAFTQFEDQNPESRFGTFLETITLDNSVVGKEEENQGEVSLMTIHGAKGLEFEYVFVTGVEETVFPSYQSMENGEAAIEEERRLFYVAMTRAMKHLYITFAQGRMLFGQLRFNGFSRFIQEIPNKYYTWRKIGGGIQANEKDDWDDLCDPVYDDEPVYRVDSSASKKMQEKKATYPKGSKIVHSLYGEGTVLDCIGPSGDEKVTIKFNDGAQKKFMAKFAPLTLI
ncbi:ATP-dependent helicase [Halobacteriovorax sp.]|uniref:ATP-dependent helicase n=1 Tax=Halobacteriovorax sp. TaxID=2020862 RepID=UPI003AF2477C